MPTKKALHSIRDKKIIQGPYSPSAALIIPSEFDSETPLIHESIGKLIQKGGNQSFIECTVSSCLRFLKRSNENEAPFKWSKGNLRDIKKYADKLRLLLGHCDSPLLNWGGNGEISFEADVGLIGLAFTDSALTDVYRKEEKEISDEISLLPKKLNKTQKNKKANLLLKLEQCKRRRETANSVTKEILRDILFRLVKQSEYFLARFNEFSSHRRGSQVKKLGRYYWLGLWVPYTASLNKNHIPYWAWIDKWLVIFGEESPSSQKIWNKEIEERRNKINPGILRTLKHSVSICRASFRNMRPANAVKSTPEEEAYCAAIKKHLPGISKE